MTRKHVFPAGTYYIGDPCYLIPDEEWDGVLEKTNFFGIGNKPSGEFDDGVYQWRNRTCFTTFTKHGDGCYGNRSGSAKVAVDSGTIGILPIEKSDTIEAIFSPYTMVRTFGKKFEVWEEDGVFHFGKRIKINTN